MEGGRGKSATSSDRHSSGDGKKSKGKEVRKEGEENGNGHPLNGRASLSSLP
jgi:hypothetical protein